MKIRIFTDVTECCQCPFFCDADRDGPSYCKEIGLGDIHYGMDRHELYEHCPFRDCVVEA